MVAALILLIAAGCSQPTDNASDPDLFRIIADIEEERVLALAEEYWDLEPGSVTDSVCDRSFGGSNDFYSEGDYWWPDPENPGGPYIRRDGQSNPENFSAHRHAMIRMSKITGVMTSAYLLSGEDKYAEKAMEHFRVWFIDESTRMNPSMLYSQAIMGRHTGRGIGIIDAIHLVEPALAIRSLERSGAVSNEELMALKGWYEDFLNWISTHPYGIDEMVHPNNHGTCWALQAAAYSTLTGNAEAHALATRRYREVLLPDQMAENGSFPMELERTKPYSYSIFNLDAMSALVQVLSLGGESLFHYKTNDGRSLKLGMDFLFPYIQNKQNWPYKEDVLYFDEYPVQQGFLLFGGLAYNRPEYIELWKKLESDPGHPEVIRTNIVKNPIIWLHLDQAITSGNPARVLSHTGEVRQLEVPDSLWDNRGSIAFEFKLSEERSSGQDLLNCPPLYLMLRGNFIWPEFSAAPTPEGARAERIQFAFFHPEQWYHLTVCWDGPGSRMRLYLNGDLQQLANMHRWTRDQFSGPMILGDEHIVVRNVSMFDGFADEDFVKGLLVDLDLVPLDGEGREVYEGPMETDRYDKRLLYETDFSGDAKIVHEQELFKNGERVEPADDTDWVIEGRAAAEITDGKMVVSCSTEGDPSNNHAVLWNTRVFPENFLLEFEMTPKDPGTGLAIIFFCASAREGGGSVFSKGLPERDGHFTRYNRGAINCYHTSYWASGGDGSRLTTNLRKNHGFKLVALGDENIAATTMDVRTEDAGPFKVRLMKLGNKIQLETRDQLVLSWEDDGKEFGPVYGAGQIGLRQMGHAGQVSYDAFKVYEIVE